MKQFAATLIKIMVAVVLSAPFALALTWMAMPLWNALERSGIESVGHSGPAGWCYVASYALVLAAALLILLWPRSRSIQSE